MANTIHSLPIDFDFYNTDEEQVLFITDDVAGQTMTLEIKNTSDEPIITAPLTGDVSSTICHFELVFRPDTLYNNPSSVKLEDTKYEMFADKDAQGSIKSNSDGTLSLFFKVKSSTTLGIGDKMRIKLSGLRAAASDGTRGTRILLRYRNLLHTGNTNSFSGFRDMPLNIVNHRGKQNIPLHVGFVGANTVLNDGKSPNTLKLRISNISRKNVALDTSATAKLTLVLEGGLLSEEWALATTDQIKNAIVKYKKPQDTALQYDATGTTEWVIPFVKLEKGQFIDVEISNLITDHPTGHANLYLHYENIPGYWDGEKTLIIEKSPLVFKNKNVGVGTSNPEMKLDVVGALGVRNEAAWDHFYIEHDGATAYLNAGGAENGMALRVGTGANGSYKGQDYTDVMRLMPNGNVGIGATNPASKLEVKGEIKMTAASKGIHGLELARIDEEEREHKWKFWHMDAAYGRNSLQIWEYRSDADGKHCTGVPGTVCWHRVTIKEGGNVGIGTNNPQEALEVIGNVKATSFIGPGVVVRGMIVMWSGALDVVPATWALCDGQNGTPDLRNRFIVGAGNTYQQGATGGQDTVTLNIAQIPAHSHSGQTSADGNHQHWIEGTDADGLSNRQRTIPGQTTVDMGFGGGRNADPNDQRWRGHVNTDTTGNHAHSFNTSPVGGNGAHENRPPYYALAFIMKL